ncbi:hypothetical protein BDZ91DRAFT_206086 [Kalaharituber pfeilii]|nr:hypothetical protein BDZ91DRAFT_206086 [Kalaharituber pfeilii]
MLNKAVDRVLYSYLLTRRGPDATKRHQLTVVDRNCHLISTLLSCNSVKLFEVSVLLRTVTYTNAGIRKLSRPLMFYQARLGKWCRFRPLSNIIPTAASFGLICVFTISDTLS